MPHLSDFLLPEAISLSLASIEKEAMLQEVLQLLRHDRRITNWQEFSSAILQSSPFPLCVHERTSVMIYHARTNSTQDLIMAVGRSQYQSHSDQKENASSLIFVIGIPHALSSDYLRVIGTIARTCQDAPSLEALLSAAGPQELIAFLAHKNCL